jgi:hypothetical protein
MVFCNEPLERVKPHVFVWISWWVLWRSLCMTNHSKKFFEGKLLLAHPLQRCPWLLQELWCMSSLCTKVYYEQPFTPHTTFGTFWKMGNWFNGAIANDQERALIHCGCHKLPHKAYRNTCLEIFSEIKNSTIFIWTNFYSIWDTIQYYF